jgi:hypothetical protein
MALRMLREEAARRVEPERRPTRALGTEGTRVDVLLTGLIAQFHEQTEQPVDNHNESSLEARSAACV